MSQYENSVKLKAREQNIKAYRELTGNFSLPADRQYWTLCNRQSTQPESEINQLIQRNLLCARQFCGVDYDLNLIAQNRLDHPFAHWFAGDWFNVLETAENFNPGLIYLDTLSGVRNADALRRLVLTMLLCPKDAVICANFLLTNPYRKDIRIDEEELAVQLELYLSSEELGRWGEIQSYKYNATGRTWMITYILHKRGANESVESGFVESGSECQEIPLSCEIGSAEGTGHGTLEVAA